MTRICLSLLVWIGLATASLGDTFVVRSGEHAGFSRLVIDFPQAPEWRLTSQGRTIALQFQDMDGEIDVSRVFRFISRDRIADISYERDSGRLLLDLACECRVDAFALSRGALVVDVADATQGADPAPATPLAETVFPDEPTVPEPPRLPELAAPAVAPVPAEPSIWAAIFQRPVETALPSPEAADSLLVRPAPPSLNLPDAVELIQAPVLPSLDADPISREAAHALPATLIEQLSRASSQGFLTLSPSFPPRAEPQETAADPDPAPAPDVLANVQVRTGLDQGGELPDLVANLTRDPCRELGNLDMGRWFADMSAHEVLAQARSSLLSEEGGFSPEALEKLARAYVYLSFGHEARLVLRDPAVASREILLALADIVETGATAAPGPLARAHECSNAAALWAVMADPDPARVFVSDRNAVALTFSGMPAHLRRHLGPFLAQAYIDAGDREFGLTIRNTALRGSPEAVAGLKLLDVELSEETGVQAEPILRDLAFSNAPEAPLAVIQLVDRLVSEGREVPRDVIDLAATLAFENAQAELAGSLLRAEILGMISQGEIEVANALADRALADDAIEAEVHADLMLRLGNAIAAVEDEQVFLRYALVLTRMLDDSPSAMAVRKDVAGRLLDMGFWQGVEQLVTIGGQQPSSSDLVLLGRMLNLSGQAQLALEKVAGLSSMDAVRVRAAAYDLLGRHEEAGAAFREISEADEGARQMWLAGQWDALAEGPSNPEADAARLIVSPILGGLAQSDTDMTPPIGELERNARLLDASAASRETLTRLLESLEIN